MFTKRIIPIILITLLMISLAACSGNDSAIEFDEAALQNQAETIFELMLAENFQAVQAQFDDQMAGLLSTKDLGVAWETVVSDIGAYHGHHLTTGETEKEYYVVQVINRFELNNTITNITFDSTGEIAGLWMNYYTIESGPIETTDFKEYEISIGEYDLAGLLTIPTGSENPPVVLLISGSGATDKNETIGAVSNTPFRDIAHGLATLGIATLRYDDRYFAYPEMATEPGGMTIEAEVLDDAYAAIVQLASDNRIDSDQIFVLGHSLGGMLVPKIAADNEQVKGIISLAGSLRNLAEISWDQNMAIAEAVRPSLSASEQADLDVQLAQVETDVAAIIALTKDDGNTYLTIEASYWYSLNQAAGLNYIDQLDIPILIAQGSADFQVYPTTDYALWQDHFQNNPAATFRLYDDLNHLFMPSNGLNTVEEYNTPDQVSQEVIDDIASWINEY